MPASLALQSFCVWLVFLATAILNGWIREQYLENLVPPLAAHQLSTLLLCCAIFVLTVAFIHLQRIADNSALLAIGLFWVCLTVTFEFLFFHFIAGIPWPVLLADYNILEGRVFSLVLITTLVSPLIAGRLCSGRNTA